MSWSRPDWPPRAASREDVPPRGAGDGRVLLVRHGPVTAAWRGRLYGQLDAEAASLAGVGPASPVDAVVCSDLGRARATAVALFPGVARREDADLRETSYGELEGADLLELHTREPDLWDRWLAEPDRMRFPGGESFGDVTVRAVAAVERARGLAPDGTVAVISHGGPIRCVVAWVLGATAHGVGRLRVDPLHAVELRYVAGVPVVWRANVPVGPGDDT